MNPIRINTSTHYAIHMLMYLAEQKQIVSSAEIAKQTRISQRYLLMVAAKLRDGKLVGVSNGSGGGYFLLREPTDISLFDIITLMENGEQVVPAVEPDAAEPLHSVYLLLRDYVVDMMRSLTLDIMANGTRSKWENIISKAIL